MSICEYLQIEGYLQNEHELFTSYESLEIIAIYDSMNNLNIDRKQKITNIKNLIHKIEYTSNIIKKKIIVLIVFYILKTTFGISLIQENEKFRTVVFEKYNKFITEEVEDQCFIEILKKVKI